MSKTSENPRRALGKGLSALLASRTPPKTEPSPPQPLAYDSVSHVPIALIDPNPVQPRTVFNQDRLKELADSIQANGIIQPLVVRPHRNRYQLVAGERRLRAARIAGLEEVPAVVQNVSDERLLEITLVENIQREDLNAIEIAHAFDRLSRELDLNHDEIARRTGKDRSTITNTLRLLKLPADVQQLVAEHRLSVGHARTILSLPTEDLQRQVAEKSISQGLSVRQVERIIQRMTTAREAKPPDEVADPNVKAAIAELERVLGTRVRIAGRPDNRGSIEIDYYSSEDLDRIYSLIVGEQEA
jgi:ParB family transcriptional regulator, chromosome partitioning protein